MQVRCVRTNVRRSDGSMSRSVGAVNGSAARGRSAMMSSSVYYHLLIGYGRPMTQARRKVRRTRAVRDDIRERLLEAALAEFGAKGFAGASTHAIARRIGAHQPQINYLFASKEALWSAAVD